MARYGIAGSVQVLEFARQEERWNVHSHEIFGLSRDADGFTLEIKARWHEISGSWADVAHIQPEDRDRAVAYIHKAPSAILRLIADALDGDVAAIDELRDIARALKGVRRSAGRLPTG